MSSISFPLVPPVALPPALAVEPVAPLLPAALLAAEAEALALPQLPLAEGAPPAPPAADGAAMRPDQVFMARQLAWPSPDGAALASSWRAMVRTYGSQLAARDQQARASQLPAALLLAGQEGLPVGRALGEASASPADAWRFTVHAHGPQERRLSVINGEPDQPPGRRRRARAALRLELELGDGTRVVVQAEPLPGGVGLELCAAGAAAAARLRELQPLLEDAVGRAGLRVLRWRFRDSVPPAPVHARLAASDAAMALSLPVFRALAELALLLPAA